ncbi:MAG: hypothetical protein FMNOHCHN_03967 [Ignavibacteriaceae bacterium]|nr:hypothetical protein [Ignavibacteriaceae bacterium]
MKLIKKQLTGKSYSVVNKYAGYDNYLAVDWSQSTMAIAMIRAPYEKRIRVTEHPSSLKQLQQLLKSLSGKTIIVLEESSPAHWLFVNLYDYAAKVVICDPYQNRLLTQGPKTDPIDAQKLCTLLYNGMLKETYHAKTEEFELRKHISAYTDLVKRGVKLQNQKKAFLGQDGLSKKTRNLSKADKVSTRFILDQLETNIQLYQKQKEEYEELFKGLCKKNKTLKNLMSIPGIGIIGAVSILGIVVDVMRFDSVGRFLAYAGLVCHIMQSGGKTYGRRRGRYSRVLKQVFKVAAMTCITTENELSALYKHLLGRGVSPHNARHAIARYVARVTFGILKTGKPYTSKKTEVKVKK